MIRFDVLNRFSGKVQFTAEIDCDESAAKSIKLGLAVRWAIKARANLTGADLTRAYLTRAYLTGADLTRAYLAGANLAGAYLTGADLTRAYLAGANLAGANLVDANLAGANLVDANLAGAYLVDANLADANLIDGGQRSDGYRFVGWIKDGDLQIRAGCRNFNMAEAREHWAATRGGTPLGDETMAILDHVEAVARIRGLTGKTEPVAA